MVAKTMQTHTHEEGRDSDLSKIDKTRKIAESDREESDDFILLDADSYSKVATPSRRKIIETLRHQDFSSQKELAEKLGRDEKNIHDDLELLRRHGVVEFESDGRSKKPKLKHQHVVAERL